MASIQKEVPLDIPADRAWAVLRDVGHADRLFADVLVDAKLDGDVRTVTFKNGMVVRERILDVDEEHRRVAYAAMDPPFAHHSASMQIFAEPDGRCRFVWNTDFMPADLASGIGALIEEGCRAMKQNLEGLVH